MKKTNILVIALTIGIRFFDSFQCYATDLTPRSSPTAVSNYILTLIPQTNAADADSMVETIQYFDGLGRPCQTVQWKGSPLHRDIVTPIVYDVFGREDKKYLPYPGSNNNGAFVTDPPSEQSDYYEGIYPNDGSAAYSKTEFELSPLDRILRQGAPGAAWQPGSTPSTDHSVKFDYGINVASEVKRWEVTNGALADSGYYAARTLFKTTTWDENNDQTSCEANCTKEFKDKLGRVILKRSFYGSDSLSTYYVYDDFGLLRFVLPPKAEPDISVTSTELSELCYQYKYDGLKRMIVKKLPGADSISMVYDRRDRLVMSQDGVARAAGKWLFTKYDTLNRPAITGYIATGQTAAQLRTAFVNPTPGTMCESTQSSGNIGYTLNNSYLAGLTIAENDILSITYYDNYNLLNINGFSAVTYDSNYDIDTYSGNYFTSVKGQVTGTKIKVLDGNEFNGSAKWLYMANYYDDRYRVIQSRRTLYDGSSGGVETLANEFDFTGKSDSTKLVQTFNSVTTALTKYFTYDHMGRLTKVEQKIDGDTGNGRVTVAENVYNETGQLTTKKLHKKTPYDYLQNVDYNYNIRGWLTAINNPDNLSGDLFAEKILYDGIESGLNSSTTTQYNGNISAMILRSCIKNIKRGYEYSYDGLNRLTQGDFKSYNGSWADSTKYEERSLTYDKNGNINTLIRTDQNGSNSANYAYNYAGNQLSNINSGTSYTYDLNGNTLTDGLRGMTIRYNVLNLPKTIRKESDSISYIYSALGEKLAKRNVNDTYKYYTGSMIYNNDRALDYILFDEGVVYKSSGAYTYTYHLKDHLGNTRMAFKPNSGTTDITQVAEYYPFGSNYTLINASGTNNKYLYNWKENQDDQLSGTYLDEYDYGARFYDPRIGRWHVQDLMSEFYSDISSYAYTGNNPISFIDPDGNFRTRFGAWLWKLLNGGGDVLKDKGGEYFVSQEENYDGEGAGVAVKRTFDWKGRSKGRDLESEALLDAYKTQYNFSQTLDQAGIEYSYTNNISEARASFLQIPAMVILPSIIKPVTAATSSVKSGINSVDDLINATGKLTRLKGGVKQGILRGNARDIYKSITRGGTKIRGNMYKMKDGTLVNFHESTTTRISTIDINKAGEIFKIRIQ